MADDSAVVLTAQSFIKPILHAAKYPHCSINGVFLTHAGPRRSREGDGLNSPGLVLVDSIPLFHSSLTLAPMMEMALTQIDIYCQSKNLVIGGYYQANENLDNNKPVGVAYRLADKIKETCGDAVLIMIDNSKALVEPKDAYIVYSSVDGKWKPSDKGLTISDEADSIGSSLLKRKAYRELIDYDNFLDDITLDWQNPYINELITQQS